MKRFKFVHSITKGPIGNATMVDGLITVELHDEVNAYREVKMSWMLQMIASFLVDVPADQRSYPIRQNEEQNLEMTAFV